MTLSRRVVAYNLSMADQLVLVGDQTLKPDRPSGVKLGRGDSDLRPKAIAEAIRKTGGAVAIDAGRIHHLQEVVCCQVIFCQNTVGVVASEAVDMGAGLLDTVHQLNRSAQGQVLGGIAGLSQIPDLYGGPLLLRAGGLSLLTQGIFRQSCAS